MSDFANRLRKMSRHYDKWARRKGISCYRVYDADLPSFPLAVDRYAAYVHVAEYKRKHPLTDDEHEAWRAESIATISEVLEVPEAHIFFKERKRQKGKEQYEKQEVAGFETVVEEAGLQFIVNLSDYLDTGLFLDHRNLRARVREEASGKRVLNLFAYTGSFTVHAAAGDATDSLTIDLSNTYLEWGQRNLALNQLDSERHRYLRADVKAWLKEEVQEQFDIIVLDPPTFSNSKAMRNILDTQADHPYMINACLRRLAPGGTLYFSTNYRRFQLEEEKIWQGATAKEISGQTVPDDFRNKKIHRSWEIRYK